MSDIENRVEVLREHALADNMSLIGLRMYDGVMEMLTEVIRELRQLNENIEKRGA